MELTTRDFKRFAPGLTMSDSMINNPNWPAEIMRANVATRALKRDANPEDLIGAAILVVIAVSYIHPLTSYRHAQKEVRDRQAAITALERDNTELTKKLMDAGKSDYVIREARRLGLVREGEHLFIVKGVGTSEERAVP